MDTKKLRQKILDLAIRGKLVPQDPNDEPASVLLERIRTEKERLIKEGKIKRSKKTAFDDEIEAPFEIPESWEWCRLEYIVSPDCTLGYGIVQPMEDVHNGIPVVRPVDLTSPIIGIKGLKRIDEKISNSYQRTILKGGEILFCVRASVGKVGIASGQLRGANVTRGISPLRFDFEYLTKYAFYHLQSLFSQTEIKSYSRGATLQQINVEDLKLLLIAVPPLSEQKRIVDEIERWFTLIDELESNEGDLLRAIDKAKSKILDLAIHGKLVPQDPNDEPAIELLKRINPKFEPFDNPHYTNVKRGWCLAKLEDVIELLDNKRIPVKSEEREQRIKNKERLYPYYGATGFVGYIDNYILDGHYILLGEDGAPFEDKHANVAYEVKGKIWVNNHAHILSPKISFKYLLHSLNAVDYTLYAKGTTRLKLTQKDMLNMPVFVPPYQEQFRIVTKIEELFAVFDSIKESLG